MEVALSKYEDGFGIKIPNSIVNELNLKENSLLSISALNNEIIIKNKVSMEDLCAQITDENLNIDTDFSCVGKEW